MFVLHRDRESKRADEIQDKLQDLVVAHMIAYEAPPNLPHDVNLPVLVEGDDLYVGGKIDRRLVELETNLAFSRQLSGDACYVDPDNPEGCL